MKKLLLSALACVAFVGSGFASNEVILEILKNKNDGIEQATVPCRWRTVYYYSDGTVEYGPWTYGDCYDSINVKGDRKLIPIKIGKLVK